MFGYLRQTAEVRSYLKHFGAADTERFAVIKVTGDLLHLPGEAERVASALAFLDRMGLVPIVVHGAGLFSGRRAAEVAEAIGHDAELGSQSSGGTDGASSADERRARSKRGLKTRADRQAMRAARRYMSRANRSLCRALEALGVQPAPMLAAAFEAEPDGGVRGAGEGVVGVVTGVKTTDILAAVRGGSVPVIAALAPMGGAADDDAGDTDHSEAEDDPDEASGSETEGEGAGGSGASLDAPALTFSTWDAAAALARELQPLKVIVLRPEGGFLQGDGSRLSRVSLARDLDMLCPAPPAAVPAEGLSPHETAEPHGAALLGDADGAAPALSPAHRHLLEEAALLPTAQAPGASADGALAAGRLTPDARGSRLSAPDQAVLRCVEELYRASALEPGATVAVTSPQHLAAELFTERGAGTLIVRGEKVQKFTSFAAMDTAALQELLEEAFGKELPRWYFDDRSPRLRAVYASESMRGVAIVTEEDGVAYLDKFAVSPSAQGDKLGDDVWRALVEGEPRLFWRSRADNRVNSWYFERAHGSYTSHEPKDDAPSPRDADFTLSSGAWTVFWRGLEDSAILPVIRTGLRIPKTFS